MKKLLLTSLMTVLSAIAMMAQVTTGGIGGIVLDKNGEPLTGTTVKATHAESGTVYYAVTQTKGQYNISGMRVGGYNLEFTYIGFNPFTVRGIAVTLGDPIKVDATLDEDALSISEVVVTGQRASTFSKERTGAATNISSREMNLLPSLNRSLTDYAKYSPHSTGGSSFGGREAYTTNITVDGANFNNNFGLSSDAMPGVSGQPISMDAIEEMQVVVAPYDVRQSNFTGAGVNAVTKSGTNTYRGTVYGYFRNQDLAGYKIKDVELDKIKTSKKTVGFSAGGPLVKDKLFFFINGEMDTQTAPGNTLLAKRPGLTNADNPTVNKYTEASQLEDFSSFLKQKFNYETGRYEKWGGDETRNNKLMARIDWNIDRANKMTLRYNYSDASNVSRPSSSGDVYPSISGGRHDLNGGMSFENSQFFNESTLHSITGELHTRLLNGLSNHFLAAYTYYDQPRTSNSSIFPMIDIMRGDETGGYSSMTAGYELFSYGNSVKNNTLIITDNVSMQLGDHNLTAGLSYENQYFLNNYVRNGTGYYRFKDLDSFKRYVNGDGDGQPYNSDYHPLGFAYTYPINGNASSAAELSFGQFSAYAQDEWSLRNNLKVTYGLRIDMPMYHDGAQDNPLTHDLKFKDGETVDLGSWPDAKVLLSPRLGFNWDVRGDRSLTVRGGTGVFTGRIPFVWFTAQPNNSGMLQYKLAISGFGSSSNNYVNAANTAAQAKLARIPFSANAADLLGMAGISDIFPQQNVARGDLGVIAKDFKLPQIWRTSIATDIRLPYDMMLTLEGVYTKDINSIYFENINLKDPDATIKEGDNEREYYTAGTQWVVPNSFENVVVMRNTDKGQSLSLTAELKIPEIHGFSGSFAYSYNWAEEVTGKNGSDPVSAWKYRQTLNSLNTEELGMTINNTPHRVMANLNYHKSYAKYFGTTVSLIYLGYSGTAYSYTYYRSPMNEGVSTALMYIPKEKDDVIWTKGEADWDAYLQFVSNDKYLKDNMGKYMKRYGANLPWNDRFDLRLLQDFKFLAGSRQHTLQFSMDVINVANLLNSDWGINKELNGSYGAYPLLRFEGLDAATGKAKVSMNKNATDSAHRLPSSTSATWAIQFGLRYSF